MAEIKLNKSLEKMITDVKVPESNIALKDPGFTFKGDNEINLMMDYVSGDFLNVVICEVKRADTYLWQTNGALPNKQAVNKAEIDSNSCLSS